jgi:ubiquinone/menaquinone biosynthesis C-methylase UbiE
MFSSIGSIFRDQVLKQKPRRRVDPATILEQCSSSMTSAKPSSQSNSDQQKYWNSSAGKKWVKFQDELDRLLERVNDQLLQRSEIKLGERVLDIGCGTGATTMSVASLAGINGLALGVDISKTLLDCAKSRNSNISGGRIEYSLADAQTWRFNAGSFDLLISRFGMMFFANPVLAFKNLSVALREGGRMSFVSWADASDNPWFSIPRDAAIEQLGKPTPSPPTAPGPLAFASVDHVLKIMDEAGLEARSADIEQVDLLYSGGVAEAAHLAGNVGPAMRIMKEFDGSPADIVEIKKKVAVGFQKFAVDGGLRIPATLNFFKAIKA